MMYRKNVLFLMLFCCFYFVSSAQNYTVKTKGVLPYLLYGNGTDRLGGAKMTYIDTAVLLKTIGTERNLYIVQLSQNHKAYIPREYAEVVNKTIRPNILSGSIKATGDSLYDYVTFNTTEKLPYRSIMQVNPSKVIVDVFGIANNTNWVMHKHDSLQVVRQVSTEQIEDDVFRIIIDLKEEQNWGYKISYDTAHYNYLTIRLKHPPKTKTLKNLKVAIDAGHGGSNRGARGKTVVEKEYNLMIAKMLQRRLENHGAKVFMTRTTDVALSMEERLAAIQHYQPDIMVSIHLNASANPEVKGVSTYYRYAGFKDLSLHILDRIAELDIENWGSIGNFNFTLNGSTEYPNSLIEVAFVSNEEDERKILNPRFREQVVNKIHQGLEDFIKAKNK